MAQAVGLRQLFQISDTFHGKGKVVFAWNADGTLLCTAGSNGAPPADARFLSGRLTSWRARKVPRGVG